MTQSTKPESFNYGPAPTWPKREDSLLFDIIEIPSPHLGSRAFRLFAIRRKGTIMPQLHPFAFVRKHDAEREVDNLDAEIIATDWRTRLSDTLVPVPPCDSSGRCHICNRPLDYHNSHELRNCSTNALEYIFGSENSNLDSHSEDSK